MTGMKHTINRALIVFACLSCIGLFLYLPQLIETARTPHSINVLAWPNILDAQYIKDFERETGIKVYMSYFENYEELFVKLRTGGGKGYDLVMPSDFIVDLLVEEDLLQQLDWKKLTFRKKLHSFLLNHEYDPGNRYTIPIGWSVYGLGIDTDYFDGHIPEPSWDLLFGRSHGDYHVGMPDDAREISLIAAHYLFGNVATISNQMATKIKQLLIKQKDWVVMYSDLRTDYLLLSKAAPVVLGMHPDLSRAVRDVDNLAFVVPKEGSFVIIDSLAIPKASNRQELTYKFINYLYRPAVLQKYVDRYHFFSPIKKVKAQRDHLQIPMSLSVLFSQLSFFKNIVTQDVLSEIWISLKS